MWQSFSRQWRTAVLAIGLPVWAYGAFIIGSVLASALLTFVPPLLGYSLQPAHQVVLTLVLLALSWVLALLLAIGVPRLLLQWRTTWQELGLCGWPAWQDIALPLVAFLGHILMAGIATLLAARFFAVDVTQQQALPFTQSMLLTPTQLLIAALALVVVVPLAEELLFRGYVYAQLRRRLPAWLTIGITGIAFGLAHLWSGPGQPLHWALMINTAILGLLLGILREVTGALWASIALHALKNGVAFYFLFVNPLTLATMNAATIVL